MLKQIGELRSKRDDERQSPGIENTTRSLSSCFVGLPCLHKWDKELRFEKITFTFKFRPKLKCVRDRNTRSLFWNCPVYKKNCNSFKREKRFDGLVSD